MGNAWLRCGRVSWRLAFAITVACATSLTAAADDGHALEFDGTQQVDGTNSELPQGNAERTIEAWIKPSVLHGGTIFNYGTFATNKRSGILYIEGRLYYVGESNDYIGSTDLDVGEWTHVAASYDGSTMTLYVNGVAETATHRFNTGAYDTTGSDWRIGNGVDYGELREAFQGVIDEVRVWDYARSQAEIQAAMDYRLTGYEPGLVAYYNLNDGPDSTTTRDASRSMSDGDLYGHEEDLPEWVDGHEQMVPTGGFGPYDRPLFLVFSLPDEEEEAPGEFKNGGRAHFVYIGDLIAGEEIPNSRFELLEELENVLPEGVDSFEELDGSEFTVIGTFNTFSPNSIHLVSPSGEPIPRPVQEAFFAASPFLDLVPDFPSPTTGEMAQFVYDVGLSFGVPGVGPGPASYGADDIEEYIFIPGEEPLSPTVEAEGELFPHDDPTKALFSYAFTFDESGEIGVAVSYRVDIDLKPGDDKNTVNYKSKGKVWCAILTTEGFDPFEEVDVDTVRLGDAEPLQTKAEDVDGDGNDDLVLKFERVDIGLDEDTETVTLTGETYAGGLIEGSDAVIADPSDNGKKK